MAIEKINIQEAISDFENLSFAAYLEKYYTEEKSSAWPYDWHYQWKSWMDKYVNPSYDLLSAEEKKSEGPIEHTGGINLQKMKDVYLQIKEEAQFPADIERFIGFLGGHGFFEQQDLCTWLISNNWSRKKKEPAQQLGTILEIMALNQGRNFIKSSLMQLDWWKMVQPSYKPWAKKEKSIAKAESPPLELIFDLQGVEILYYQTEASPESMNFSVVVKEKEAARILFFDEVGKIEKMMPGHTASSLKREGSLLPGVYQYKEETKNNDDKTVANRRFCVIMPEHELEMEATSVRWSTQVQTGKLTGNTYLNLMN